MITEQRFKDSATRIGCSLSAIKAVAEVESGGNGFLSTGEPVILFEPHIFWKRLKSRGIDPAKLLANHPEYSDILYPTWKPGKYGPSSKQHSRLQRAQVINRDAALESASWGKFQILGMNWKLCGVQGLQEFINAMYSSEDEHLTLFVDYVRGGGVSFYNAANIYRAKDGQLIIASSPWKGFNHILGKPEFRKFAK